MALFSLSSIPRRYMLYAMMSGGIFSGGSHIITVQCESYWNIIYGAVYI